MAQVFGLYMFNGKSDGKGDKEWLSEEFMLKKNQGLIFRRTSCCGRSQKILRLRGLRGLGSSTAMMWKTFRMPITRKQKPPFSQSLRLIIFMKRNCLFRQKIEYLPWNICLASMINGPTAAHNAFSCCPEQNALKFGWQPSPSSKAIFQMKVLSG